MNIPIVIVEFLRQSRRGERRDGQDPRPNHSSGNRIDPSECRPAQAQWTGGERVVEATGFLNFFFPSETLQGF